MPLRGLGFGSFDAIGRVDRDHLLTDSDIQSSAQQIVVLAHGIGRQRGFGQQIGVVALNFCGVRAWSWILPRRGTR